MLHLRLSRSVSIWAGFQVVFLEGVAQIIESEWYYRINFDKTGSQARSSKSCSVFQNSCVTCLCPSISSCVRERTNAATGSAAIILISEKYSDQNQIKWSAEVTYTNMKGRLSAPRLPHWPESQRMIWSNISQNLKRGPLFSSAAWQS
jgi:hypothetical protein